MIHLSNDRKKATVNYKGQKAIELPVSSFLGKLMIQRPPRQLDEAYMESFARTQGERIRRFIFFIIADESIESETIRILAQDDRFSEGTSGH